MGGSASGAVGGDDGTASVLVVAVLVGVVVLAVAVVGGGRVLAERSRVSGAADATALAAADVAAGLVAGSPCDRAGALATANGVVLSSCRVDELIVTVRVTTSLAGVVVGASATAGPPPTGTAPPGLPP
ncbi:secretion/DNA translocation related TadE-like protein [Frigoribacterium sp. PvP120]|uniref:Rv3654c family TadE-like protein n=1 Tax=unclassified Frigoribacterium TaxID=2627005 RepID=UPI001AE31038|nr:Rv3654c family TadE-like protein [Frigoribacterium sp. PvP121]MBP1241234.1 secretion/DNA translocation related TadE-like protein [Frigoribacterium sp. PvP121]